MKDGRKDVGHREEACMKLKRNKPIDEESLRMIADWFQDVRRQTGDPLSDKKKEAIIQQILKNQEDMMTSPNMSSKD